MPTYTMKDVKKADRLYNEMPLHEVAERIGCSQNTLTDWKQKGLIDTEANHKTKYDAQTIERADELWDAMPLSKVSSLLDVPQTVLQDWSAHGWINTDVNWRKKNKKGGVAPQVDPNLLVESYFSSEDRTMCDVAEKFGLSSSTVRYHIRKYRNGDL